MLPFNWLNHRKDLGVNVNILQNSYNAFHTPKPFFVEKYFESWDPKIHCTRNYLQIFYVAALIDKCRTTNNYPLAMYLNGIPKDTRSSVTGKIYDGILLSSSNSAMISKKNNDFCDTFKFQMKIYCLYLKTQDYVLFRHFSKKPGFILKPLVPCSTM